MKINFSTSQVFIALVAISILSLSFVVSFRWFCILGWMYGIGFGGFRYAFKILTLDRVKVKQFSKAWGEYKKYIVEYGFRYFYR